MAIKDFFKTLGYDWDEIWEYDLAKFDEFKSVNRLDELLDLIESLKSNENFHRYATLEKIGEPENQFDFTLDKVHFHKSAVKGMGYSHMIPLYLPRLHHLLIDGNAFVSVLALVQLCFNCFSGHLIEAEEDKIINLSEILPRITFFVEDFDNLDLEIPEYDESFFKTLHHVYWENKSSEKFDDCIINIIATVFGEFDLDFQYCRGFQRAAFYLMGCNALKEGRDSINCDDVITAYFTGFKIILNDIRPLVYELYDEEKWKDESSYK